MPDELSIPDQLAQYASDPKTMALVSGMGALLGGGSALYMANREKGRPGETPAERKGRLLRNLGVGAALGGTATGGGLYGTALLSNPGSSYLGDGLLGKFGKAMAEDGATMAAGTVGAGTGAGLATILQTLRNRKGIAPGTPGRLTQGMMGAARRGAGIGGATGIGVSLLPALLNWGADVAETVRN